MYVTLSNFILLYNSFHELYWNRIFEFVILYIVGIFKENVKSVRGGGGRAGARRARGARIGVKVKSYET